nr:hypothetical protein HK105_005112 [Polyrhizophydium stewartii]
MPAAAAPSPLLRSRAASTSASPSLGLSRISTPSTPRIPLDADRPSPGGASSTAATPMRASVAHNGASGGGVASNNIAHGRVSTSGGANAGGRPGDLRVSTQGGAAPQRPPSPLRNELAPRASTASSPSPSRSSPSPRTRSQSVGGAMRRSDAAAARASAPARSVVPARQSASSGAAPSRHNEREGDRDRDASTRRSATWRRGRAASAAGGSGGGDGHAGSPRNSTTHLKTRSPSRGRSRTDVRDREGSIDHSGGSSYRSGSVRGSRAWSAGSADNDGDSRSHFSIAASALSLAHLRRSRSRDDGAASRAWTRAASNASVSSPERRHHTEHRRDHDKHRMRRSERAHPDYIPRDHANAEYHSNTHHLHTNLPGEGIHGHASPPVLVPPTPYAPPPATAAYAAPPAHAPPVPYAPAYTAVSPTWAAYTYPLSPAPPPSPPGGGAETASVLHAVHQVQTQLREHQDAQMRREAAAAQQHKADTQHARVMAQVQRLQEQVQHLANQEAATAATVAAAAAAATRFGDEDAVPVSTRVLAAVKKQLGDLAALASTQARRIGELEAALEAAQRIETQQADGHAKQRRGMARAIAALEDRVRELQAAAAGQAAGTAGPSDVRRLQEQHRAAQLEAFRMRMLADKRADEAAYWRSKERSARRRLAEAVATHVAGARDAEAACVRAVRDGAQARRLFAMAAQRISTTKEHLGVLAERVQCMSL